jgi:3-hydroxybutyryl-CoA dehydrogenase
MKHPERLVVMHWAEPAHATQFMELAGNERTTPAALFAAASLAKSVGKDPCVLNRDIEGLIANRLGYAMYREAFHLLEMGVADIETIDRAFRNSIGVWAAVAGPFRWMDLTGVAAYARVMQRLWPTLSNATEVPREMRDLVAAGAHGITSRRGFYGYTDDEARRWDDIFRQNAWRLLELPAAP